MKIIIIFLLCLFSIGIASSSYAQYTEVGPNTKVPEVLLQLELRDSDGNFLTYIEAEQIIVIYPLELNKFLDNQNNKKFLIKDNKAHEIIQWKGKTETFDKQHAYSQYNLWNSDQSNLKSVLVVRHHSYQSQPGDTLTIYWTIIRSVS